MNLFAISGTSPRNGARIRQSPLTSPNGTDWRSLECVENIKIVSRVRNGSVVRYISILTEQQSLPSDILFVMVPYHIRC